MFAEKSATINVVDEERRASVHPGAAGNTLGREVGSPSFTTCYIATSSVKNCS